MQLARCIGSYALTCLRFLSCLLSGCYTQLPNLLGQETSGLAQHLRLLFRLRMICHQWRAVVDEVVAQPHTALDHSGCRRLARWMEHGIPVAYIHTERP